MAVAFRGVFDYDTYREEKLRAFRDTTPYDEDITIRLLAFFTTETKVYLMYDTDRLLLPYFDR